MRINLKKSIRKRFWTSDFLWNIRKGSTRRCPLPLEGFKTAVQIHSLLVMVAPNSLPVSQII